MIERDAPKRAGVLRKRSEYEAVLRFGLRLASRNFVVRALPNGTPYARLGIIAGRKAASRAVDRNRGKRLIREVFRAASPALAEYDVAIQLRSDLRSQHNNSVRAELRNLLESLAHRCAGRSQPSAAPQSPTAENGQ